jgi:hypothetical protein
MQMGFLGGGSDSTSGYHAWLDHQYVADQQPLL